LLTSIKLGGGWRSVAGARLQVESGLIRVMVVHFKRFLGENGADQGCFLAKSEAYFLRNSIKTGWLWVHFLKVPFPRGQTGQVYGRLQVESWAGDRRGPKPDWPFLRPGRAVFYGGFLLLTVKGA
jgi:hypothetical protein